MHAASSYNLLLVGLSIAIAIFASFTALDLAGRMRATKGASRWLWLLAAALALGGGTWSMHFVGMLAFDMPGARYDVTMTVVSLIVPIAACGLGLHLVSHLGGKISAILVGGSLIGLGVVSMHYTGMAAMQMPDMTVSYDHKLLAASVLIALVAATAALWLAFNLRGIGERFGAAIVMGFAISGMHYTGMAAANFTRDSHAGMNMPSGIESNLVAIGVATATSVLLILALIATYYDRRLAAARERESDALRQSEKRYRALIENASDIIAVMDRDGVFTYESSSARIILGYDTDDIVGRRIIDFVPPGKTADVESFLQRVNAQPGALVPGELALQNKSGEWRELEVVAKNLIDEPAIGGIVLNLRDITQRKQLMQELEKLSETDGLTGAFNRRGFLKYAEREFERLKRARQSATIVMIDIDHFKQVNDTYGHAAGDMVLAMVAERCRSEIRSIDLLGRFGGEEFVIMLADGEPQDARIVVERLRRAIAARRISTIKGEVAVTASFGIAALDPARYDLETVIRFADEALYEAKNAGRNCVRMRAA